MIRTHHSVCFSTYIRTYSTRAVTSRIQYRPFLSYIYIYIHTWAYTIQYICNVYYNKSHPLNIVRDELYNVNVAP